MYSKSFYIEEKKGNNALSYEKRQNKRLFVPSILEIRDLSQVKIGDLIAFEDFDEKGKLITAKGLNNFYRYNHNGKEIIIVDNHNHVFYFWYEAVHKGTIDNYDNTLVHIDAHSDMREPDIYLGESDRDDLQKIYEYTNYELNVGNYILPARRDGLIGDILQIRSEESINTYIDYSTDKKIILNIDLDFFAPELDYIDYDLKKKICLYFLDKAELITISSSPFFIDQNLAIKVLRDLLS